MTHIEELCSEPLFTTSDPERLTVSDESPLVYKIFRLLTGQVKISCELTHRSCEIGSDIISSLYNFEEDNNFGTRIAKYLLDDDDDSVAYLVAVINNRHLKYRNKKYFEELYEEFCNYFFAIKVDNYVAAFVHEYRIIEYIAYAYPLIYAVRSKDFYMTFGLLREFVTNEGKGELAFFKKAINKIFQESDLLSISLDITLTGIVDDRMKESYRKILKDNINQDWLHDESTDDVFKIKFNEVGSLLIGLRNKIFHYSVNTNNNLKASQLFDINNFMKLVVPVFILWLGINYIEIFKSVISFEQE